MTTFGYGEFVRMLYATGIISDPWLAGKERFGLRGIVLTQAQAESLKLAAERVGEIYNELSEIVLRHTELLDQFFNLTPWQKAMWLASDGRWHGIARVDLFICKDGRVRACELNSDTPSGEAEAVVINRLLHNYHPQTIDPNTELEVRFWQMLIASHSASLTVEATGRVLNKIAIIYPTDLPEDLSMIAIYKKWFEERGCDVLIGSPFNLGTDNAGRVTVLGEAVDLIVRHYKTDWWGERETIWANQSPFPDPDPLERELTILLEAEREGRVAVVNPFGAVVTQNKKAMALMWERRELFSAQSQDWIVEYIPETFRFASIDVEKLDRNQWVLKSDYGCEGDSVVCGPFVTAKDWRLVLSAARPGRWVAQRYFDVELLEDGSLPNYGVYLIGGDAAGFYTRVSKKATDYSSLTVPTFIRAENGNAKHAK